MIYQISQPGVFIPQDEVFSILHLLDSVLNDRLGPDGFTSLSKFYDDLNCIFFKLAVK